MRHALIPLLLLAATGTAVAQESPIPRLDDHHFVPVLALTEPFITTDVQTIVGLGKTVNATVPLFEIDGNQVLGTAKADIFQAGIGFRYQHAAKDWLAVKLALNATGRVGSDTASLLADGITGSVGYRLGWKMRVLQSRKFILSSSVSLGNNGGTFINLIDWANGIIEGQNVSLVRSRNSLQGVGGLHAGWGISRRFGLLGSFKMIYGESFDGKGNNSWDTDVRLALSYDLIYDIKAPLGLALTGGRYESDQLGGSTKDVWLWSARLAAMGRRNFCIGIDVQTSYYDSALHGSAMQLRQFSLDMRYFY